MAIIQDVHCTKDEWIQAAKGKISISMEMYDAKGVQYLKGIIIEDHEAKGRRELMDEIEKQITTGGQIFSRVFVNHRWFCDQPKEDELKRWSKNG